jgi:antitoxin PrlF
VSIDIGGRNSYNISMKSTVSEKGQITIPKSVRKALGLRPGTVIDIRAEAGVFIGQKINVEDVFVKWRGRGALPKGLSVDAYLVRARGGGANSR